MCANWKDKLEVKNPSINFKHIQYVGSFPESKSFLSNSTNYKMISNPTVEQKLLRAGFTQADIDKATSNYATMTPNLTTIVKQMNHFDSSYPDPPDDVITKYHDKAMERLFNEYSFLVRSCNREPIETFVVNPEARPGFPFDTHFGIKTKRELFSLPGALEFIRYATSDEHYSKYCRLPKKVAGKVETLKLKKCLENNGRTFEVASTILNVLAHQHQYQLNSRLGNVDGKPHSSCYGATMFKGGIFNLIRDLMVWKIIYEGDVSKMDKRITAFLYFHVILPFRMMMKQDPGPMDYEIERFLAFDACFSYVLLPNGEVYLLPGGNPSGHFGTASVNFIGHSYVMHCYAISQETAALSPLYRFFYSADDHIAGTDDENFSSYQNRKQFYAMFNLILDDTKDLVTSDLHGHSFLGFTYQIVVKNKRKYVVPTFPLDKAIASIILSPEDKYEEVEYFYLLCAFILLLWYTPGKENLVRYLRAQPYANQIDVSQVLASIAKIWTGEEAPFFFESNFKLDLFWTKVDEIRQSF